MKIISILKKLKFEPKLEDQYRNYITIKDKNFIRVELIIFSIFYALFSWTDYVLFNEFFRIFFVIRFFVVIPILLITVIITFHPKYYKWNQTILLFDLIIGGFGIAIMLILAPFNIIYYGGLFLIFTAGYFMLTLNTNYAIWGGVTITAFYIAGVLLTDRFDLSILSAILFLIAENIIGAIGAFKLEQFKRNEFLNVFNLNKTKIELSNTVKEKMNEILEAQISTIRALAKLAESRDKETGEHIERVGEICYKIANVLPLNLFASQSEKDEFSYAIQLASALHDIGKVGISDEILNKPGPLNKEEFEIMSRHTEIGSATLIKLNDNYPNNSFVQVGIEITHSHHERWDGSGYPEGLSGYDIPLSARIMAIADVYDALVSKRPYKPAYSHEHSMEVISSESGTHFDPELVKLFCELFKIETEI